MNSLLIPNLLGVRSLLNCANQKKDLFLPFHCQLVLLAQNPSQRVQMTPGMEPESRPSIAKRLLALASLQTEEEANENRYSASFC